MMMLGKIAIARTEWAEWERTAASIVWLLFRFSCYDNDDDDGGGGDGDNSRIWAQICSVLSHARSTFAQKWNGDTKRTGRRKQTNAIIIIIIIIIEFRSLPSTVKRNAHAILSHQFCYAFFLDFIIFGWRCASDWPLRIVCNECFFFFCCCLLLSFIRFYDFVIVILDESGCVVAPSDDFFFRRVLFWSRNYWPNIESIPNW